MSDWAWFCICGTSGAAFGVFCILVYACWDRWLEYKEYVVSDERFEDDAPSTEDLT